MGLKHLASALALLSVSVSSFAKGPVSSSSLPDAPAPAWSTSLAAPPSASQQQSPGTPPPQPKRILGLMPNYRAVSAGHIPPPPSSREAFGIATRNSFDYSAFVFVGLTSLIAEGDNSHPTFGKGVPGFWSYAWRGFLDKTDGNYLVVWAYPSLIHQDVRYYALGQGGFLKRLGYSVTRIAVARDYHGADMPNYSELLGRASAQAISTSYYPSTDNSAGKVAERLGYALLRDSATNAFREFWPDIAVHVLHRHP